MSNKETGLLGLPIEFSAHKIDRYNQYWQAIRVGHDRLVRRFGKLTKYSWEPTPATVRFGFTFDQFKSMCLEIYPDDEEHFKLDPTAYRYGAMSYPKAGITIYNCQRLTTPAYAAVLTAHEEIHQWAKGFPITFHSATTVAEIGNQNEVMLRNANETLVDYCAHEAAGFLNSPITRLPDRELIMAAYNALQFKQTASVLGKHHPDIIFRITQGDVPEEVVRNLNRRAHQYSPCRNWDDFFDRGILISAGLLNMPRAKGGPEIYQEVINWILRFHRVDRSIFVDRKDVGDAEEIIKDRLI